LKPIFDQGYIIPAINSDDVDYVSCARALAKSIKYWQPTSKVCLLSNNEVTDNEKNIFDYISKFPFPLDENPLANDWQIFHASPFRQTIKIEADFALSGPIEHWWQCFQHRDVLVPVGCKNLYGETSQERFYRRVFDENNFPDVYNAMVYWRYCKEAKVFFEMVKFVFENWNVITQAFKGFNLNKAADTDTVYAIAAVLLGDELITEPFSDFFNFVHLKARHNYCHREYWNDHLTWELVEGRIKVNSFYQMYPVHYHEKSFAKKIEEHYDSLLGSN